MKKISFLLTFVALFATATFATTTVEKAKLTTGKTIIYKKGNVTMKVLSVVGTTCTVSASWSTSGGRKSNVQLTVNCEDCTTTQQACDQAYKLLSILIPG
jgi:hypothetical protein